MTQAIDVVRGEVSRIMQIQITNTSRKEDVGSN